MPPAHFFAGIFLVWLTLIGMEAAHGQDYPVKPIRIVTTEPGGGNDFVARLIAQGLTGYLSQAVIVDNRASLIIAADSVAKTAPDGYTLFVTGGALWIVPFMRDQTPYDAVKDFSPITLAVSTPNILIVHPSLRVNSVRDLIALAKAKPGVLNYGSGNSGAITHLAPELFKAMAGVNIVRIPYKGAGPALNALVSGEVQLMFTSGGGAPQLIKAGRLKALAVTTAQPSALYPGLPTIAASGVPGYESVSPFGMFAPANTPEAIIRRLNQETIRVLARADVKDKLLNAAMEPVGSSPGQFAATVKSEMTRLGKVIKDAGIRAD